MKKILKIKQWDISSSLEEKIMDTLINNGYFNYDDEGFKYAKKDFALIIEAIEEL